VRNTLSLQHALANAACRRGFGAARQHILLVRANLARPAAFAVGRGAPLLKLNKRRRVTCSRLGRTPRIHRPAAQGFYLCRACC
jgi:hypothetical protein